MADKIIGFKIEVKGSEQIVKTIGDLEKLVKQTNKELKNTQVGTEEYKRLDKTLSVAKDQLQNVRKEQRLAIKEAEGVRAASGSYKELNAELIGLKDQFRKLGREAREGIGGKRLTARIQELDSELKDLDKTIGQNQRNVGNYASAFEGLGGAIGGNIGTLAALVTGKAGLEEAVGLFIDGAVALGELVDEFAVLRGEIEQLTGATGGELDEFTTRIAAIASTFGVSTEDVLQSANSLTNQLTGDFTESLTAIEQGFVAGADANGEFLDSLKEYSTQAKASGLDTAEFVSILNQSAKEGVFSDKGIDAVKEFGLRIREQTKPTRDALDAAFGADFTNELFDNINSGVTSTADALKIVSQRLTEGGVPANELQTILADVFGGAGEDAGLDFLKVLGDINTDINNLEGSTSEYAKRQADLLVLNQGLAAASNELAKELQPVGNFFIRLGKQIGTVLLQTLSVLIDSLKFVGSAFVSFGSGIAGVIRNIPILGAGFDFIADRAASVGAFFTEKLPAAFAGFQAAAAQVVQNVSSLFQRLTLSAQIAGKSINASLAIRSDTRARLNKELEDLKEQRKAAENAGGSIGEAFNTAFTEALTGGKTLDSPVSKVFDASKIDIAPVVTKIDEVGDAASDATSEVKDLEKSLRDLGRPLDELKTQEIDGLGEVAEARKKSTTQFFAGLQEQAEMSRDAAKEKRDEDAEIEKEERKEQVQSALNVGNELVNTAASISDAIKAVRLKKLDEQFNAAIKGAKGNEEEETRIAADFAKRREKIQLQAAKREKAIKTASTIINGAAALIKNFAEVPYPASLVTAALLAAQTVAQIAVINAQKFARGGVLAGRSHAGGGIPAVVGGTTPVELEGGEAVINKRSTSMFRPLLSRINEAGGGLRFQGGGVLPSPNIRSAAQPLTEFTGAINAIREDNKATQNLALAVREQVINLNVQLDTDELEGVQNTKVALEQARTL